VLPGALVSAVNYAEVMSKLLDGGADRHKAREHVLVLGIRVVDFDADLADRAGELRPLTRHLGLSLADRACLALAERENAIAFTGDRKWLGAVAGIEIQIIR
jgi:PIN domain nuclease of toxin-antitoxin system